MPLKGKGENCNNKKNVAAYFQLIMQRNDHHKVGLVAVVAFVAVVVFVKINI